LLKRLAALMMCLSLMFGIASAEETFAPHWTQLEKEMEEGRTTRLEMSTQIKEWSPFPTEVTASINTLLKHFSFGVDYLKRSDETEYAMTVLMDENPVVTLTQRDTQDGTQWYSDLFDAVYTLEAGSGAKPLALMSEPEQEDMVIWEELLLGQIDLDGFSEHMTQLLRADGTLAKSTKNLSKVGRAAQTYKVTTDGEGAGEIVREAVKALDFPMAEAFVEQLAFSGTKNIFTLYENKDGAVLGLNFTGYAAYADGDKRKVSFTWGYKVEEDKRLDTLSLIAPSAKGSNKLTVKFTWNRSWKDSANTQSLQGTLTSTLNKVSTNLTYTMDLKNAKGLNGHQLSGTLQVVDKVDDVKHTLLVKPTLQTTESQEGVSFRGSVEVQKLQGKKKELEATVNISMDPQASPVFELLEPMEIIALEELSEEALAETNNDLAYLLAHRMLMALMTLPEDELTVLKTGISDSNWALIVEAFQQIAP